MGWASLKILEDQRLWTLRLAISVVTPYVIAPPTIGLLLLLQTATEKVSFPLFTQSTPLTVLFVWAVGLLAANILIVVRLALPVFASRHYVRLRWKAWTGPSRTGIPAEYVKYMGDRGDYIDLARSCGKVSKNPIEKFASLVSATPPRVNRITTDPTDLLKARASAVSTLELAWKPRSKNKSGVYQPILEGQSVSLLWGQELGFHKRCSRGIIAIAKTLLTLQPRIDAGHDGRAVCLAHGILARSKGLEPWKLVCDLGSNNAMKVFEENSVLYPRPAKALRGIYRTEFSRSYSLIGESYVNAATELGLLLADASNELISDWLDGEMEHQDLELNHKAHELGATTEDLGRLYRGHYAAMLVGLNTHQIGNRIRPEILVYDAMCTREGVRISKWAVLPGIEDRRRRERAIFGIKGERLVAAII